MEAFQAEFAAWILGSMSSGIVAIDGEGRLLTFNAGAQRILGCPARDASEALGRDCREVLASQPAVARLLLDTLDGRDALSRAELPLENAGQRLAGTIGFTLTPVRDGDGRVRGAAMLFRDLAPIEIRDEQVRLRERLAALGQMAAGLAHEIRNPLAGMEVLAGLLKRRLAKRPEELELVAQLLGELHSLADTVTASLEFVRPVALESEPIEPVPLLEEALATARSRVPFAGSVELDFEDDPPRLLADRDQLRAVLINLIVNALEAMQEQPGEAGRLELSLRVRAAERCAAPVRVGSDGWAPAGGGSPGRELVIAVADNGPGVPLELREKIFYPFFTTRRSGSGVGLATAQKIVASHGGVIEIDASPGPGSTFRVRVPVCEPESEPSSLRAAPALMGLRP